MKGGTWVDWDSLREMNKEKEENIQNLGHYEVFDNNKTLPESVDSMEDQVPDQLYAVLYRMAVDIKDLKEIVREKKKNEF